ncbi:serine hydrolase [Streptococcus thoraltensis]
MKKIVLFMLLPFFFKTLPVISTEVDFSLTDAQRYQLSQTATSPTTSLQIPQNPVLKVSVPVYKDADLKTPAKTLSSDDSLQIQAVEINQFGLPVFHLADQTYMLADETLYYQDVVLEQTPLSETYWTRKIDKIYDSPFIKGSKEVSQKPKDYTQVKVTAVATTHSGTYYQLDQYGWVEGHMISSQDSRMEKVQDMLRKKYQKADYGISVKQLETGQVAGINADKKMYAASLAKLPILYYTQEAINQGKINKDTKFKYISKVNDFYGSYDPSGSGSLPKKADDKEYTVDDLMKKVAQQSDNVASNMLAYYVTEQFGTDFQNYIETISGTTWDMKKRDVSPETITTVLEALYHQNGFVLDYLSKTDFDDKRISKNISDKVSHKIGDAYDYKHDAAIIYTKSPFILTIMTNKADYDDITAIADDIYEILK